MSRRRGLHKPDPARSAYRVGAHTNPRIAAVLAAGLPLSYSLSQYWRTAFNQGNSDKCHSHSASTSIAVAFASAGKKLPFDGPPSPENIAATTYANMRRASWNGISDLPKLLDTGASLEDDVGAVGQWGAGPMGALVGGATATVPTTRPAPSPLSPTSAPSSSLAKSSSSARIRCRSTLPLRASARRASSPAFRSRSGAPSATATNTAIPRLPAQRSPTATGTRRCSSTFGRTPPRASSSFGMRPPGVTSSGWLLPSDLLGADGSGSRGFDQCGRRFPGTLRGRHHEDLRGSYPRSRADRVPYYGPRTHPPSVDGSDGGVCAQACAAEGITDPTCPATFARIEAAGEKALSTGKPWTCAAALAGQK